MLKAYFHAMHMSTKMAFSPASISFPPVFRLQRAVSVHPIVCAIIVPFLDTGSPFYGRSSMIRSGARGIGFYALLFSMAFSAAAFAKDNPSYTQLGHNINIGPNDQVGDLTCFGCSIRIRGEVAGDVTTFGGSVTVEDQAQVAGDVSIFGGDARFDQGVRVAGGVSVF